MQCLFIYLVCGKMQCLFMHLVYDLGHEKALDVRSILLVNASSNRFRGVAVITSALHAEGRRFDPGRSHV